MFEIYKYNPNCQEWYDCVKNPKLDAIERKKTINERIKKIGTKLTLQEYFSIPYRASDFTKGICYRCIGKPTNTLERLAFSEMENDNDLSYISMSQSFPEDFVESRTSYEDMIDYANGLKYFIEELKDEIANGKIVFIEK
jgi:hypothetical protein